MDEEQLKEWLKENLRIEVSTRGCGGNDVRVELRFEGDQHPFAHDIISIPDGGTSYY